MDARLLALLDEVARRTRTLKAHRSAVAVWCLAAMQLLIAGIFIKAIPGALWSASISCLVIVAVGLIFVYRRAGTSAADRLDAARLVEATHPELKQRLITLLDQQPDSATGQFNILQRQLQHEVCAHSEVGNWTESVPTSSLKRSRNRAVLAMLTCGVQFVFLWMTSANPLSAVESTNTAESSTEAEAGPVTTVTVEPGSVEVERGSNVLVLARFAGPLPAEVSLMKSDVAKTTVIDSTAASQVNAPISMSKSLDDPVFGARIANVERPFEYHVVFNDSRSETYEVTVFDYPKVERVDVRLDFPSYTELSPEFIADTWLVSAVEGATATLVCSLNKPISAGTLVSSDGNARFKLEPYSSDSTDVATSQEASVKAPTSPHRVQVKVPITKSMKLHFELKDDRDRDNRELGEFRITALPNRPAEIAITFPAKDLRVSPIEELQLEATVWDDYGVKDHGLMLTVSDREPVTISLGKSAAAKNKTAIKHLVDLELAKVEPNQLVSYYFYADDVAASGKMRRTMSDMFFAEVRHFEEIFRQAPQEPSGGQQQQKGDSPQANQAGKLAEIQKQIINATWKIIRRETADELSAAFVPDVKQLLESQQQAIGQLGELLETLTDPQSKKFAEIARQAMVAADAQFQSAAEGPDRKPLTPALSSARSAAEALLKLQAREHLIQQKQNGGGMGSGAAGLAQQQLNQLELDQKKNRYEAERKAGQQSPQAAQNREQMQVLNRLKELSQRQSDVNQKLQELESALRAAKEELAKEELQRQLKRLRDEQRDLLNNVDELRDRMDKPENQQQMADSRQQLEQTRSQVRQASDALESGKLSQALNSGTRAERELQQLRDEFRQKAAGQFDESLKQLRREARELAQKQDEIAQALQDPNAPKKAANPSDDQSTTKSTKPSSANDASKTDATKTDGTKSETTKPDSARPNASKPDASKEPTRRTLRPTADNRQQLADDLKQQRDQLDRVMEQARQIVEQAETSEPVLAKELYETVRKSFSERPGEALDVTRELLWRGLTKEARQAEEIANQGIEHLQQGIDRASKLVLGDEVEALKRAREQVRQLKGSVAEEVAMNDPKRGSKESRQNAGADRSNQDAPNTDNGKGKEPSDKGQSEQGQAGSQQPDQQTGKSPMGQQPGGQQPGGQQAGGQQPGSPMSTDSASQASSSNGRRNPGLKTSSPAGRGGSTSAGAETSGGNEESATGPANPITGQGFNEFSDQLREAEELVNDPKLRADIARVREMARSMRVEFKRHSKAPEWESVRMQILQPLAEIERRIAEEIARQQSPESLVPLDKDPVPERYSELVRKYYERLSQGK